MPFENPDTGDTIDERTLYQKTANPDYLVISQYTRDGEVTRVVLESDAGREEWVRREE